MSKMKDLITDATFKLKGQANITVGRGKNLKHVVAYSYEDKESGAFVRFYVHPTKAKTYVALPETNAAGMLVKDVVIEAWVKAGGASRTPKEVKL